MCTRVTGENSCFHQVGNTIEPLLKGSVSQQMHLKQGHSTMFQ